MRLFFCLSNICVPLIISMIEESDDDFIVATGQPNLYHLFHEMYGEQRVIEIEPFRSEGIVEKILFLPRFVLYKFKLLKKFNSIRDSDIYFYWVAFGLIESWILTSLASNNRIIYNPIIDTTKWPIKFNWKICLNINYIRLLYGVKVIPKTLGNVVYWAVSSAFLKKLNASIVNHKINKTILEDVISVKFNIPESEILYLTGGIIEESFIEINEFIQKNDSLLKELQKFSLVLKLHPRFKNIYSEERNINQLPSHIPVNLLFYNFKIVIGYSSAALFEASNYGCIAISLLDYFVPKDIIQQAEQRDYLTKNLHSGKRIFYPKSIEEIEYLINAFINKK